MDLKDAIYKEWILGMVQSTIFCPVSKALMGEEYRVLDVRTCVVVLDQDGDPTMVMSPEAWEYVQEFAASHDSPPLGPGYSIMER